MRARGPVVAALAVLAAAPSAAGAEGRIAATAPNRYATPEVEIAAGERVIFANRDVVRHDVVAEDSTAAGDPLFSSPLVDPGGEAEVAGAERLGAGSYAFLCSIHPSMRGTLRVTGAGPGPGSGQPAGGTDDTPPELEVRIGGATLGRVARSGLPVVMRPDEAVTVELRTIARVRGRRLRLGSMTVRFDAAGRRDVLVAAATRARRILRRARRAAFTVTATATDGAGNRATVTARRRLRR